MLFRSSWIQRRSLKYIGFGGVGHQVRDCLHPRDLVLLLLKQLGTLTSSGPTTFNIGGGVANSMSLAQLSAWCTERFGSHDVRGELSCRPFDAPWVVMNSERAEAFSGWRPQVGIATILDEIAAHAQANPHWLDLSA